MVSKVQNLLEDVLMGRVSWGKFLGSDVFPEYKMFEYNETIGEPLSVEVKNQAGTDFNEEYICTYSNGKTSSMKFSKVGTLEYQYELYYDGTKELVLLEKYDDINKVMTISIDSPINPKCKTGITLSKKKKATYPTVSCEIEFNGKTLSGDVVVSRPYIPQVIIDFVKELDSAQIQQSIGFFNRTTERIVSVLGWERGTYPEYSADINWPRILCGVGVIVGTAGCPFVGACLFVINTAALDDLEDGSN